jgi:hypothetical protein
MTGPASVPPDDPELEDEPLLALDELDDPDDPDEVTPEELAPEEEAPLDDADPPEPDPLAPELDAAPASRTPSNGPPVPPTGPQPMLARTTTISRGPRRSDRRVLLTPPWSDRAAGPAQESARPRPATCSLCNAPIPRRERRKRCTRETAAWPRA